jgi:hypothetical protein
MSRAAKVGPVTVLINSAELYRWLGGGIPALPMGCRFAAMRWKLK